MRLKGQSVGLLPQNGGATGAAQLQAPTHTTTNRSFFKKKKE
jgi:hypothetical protein